jgi:two-component system cell cycle sensor histidine kinase/response regulator CckA
MTPARILIVEDEGVIAEELSERLTRMGLVVAGMTASGDDAVIRAGASSPDLVLMDIRLKGKIDGVDAAIAIRERYDVPVIFLTSHADTATLERAKVASPLGYLIKPFTEDDLRVTIEMALNRQTIDRKTQELLEMQRFESLGRLARGIAHEFGNLLVPITGNVRLAALHADPSSKSAKYMASIARAADRAADLCGQLRAYAGGAAFEISHSDLNTIILEFEQLLRIAVGRRGTLTFDLGSDLPRTDLDKCQIQQMLLNLTLNAAEAVAENGVIVVRTSRLCGKSSDRMEPGGDSLLIEVSDNGAGMGAETQARMFEPFFTTKPSSRGLGLAAAQGIAQAHRGAITADSAPGVGSTFRVCLPVVATAQPAASDRSVP